MIKVDISFMALRIREFYARKSMCEQCIEHEKECPYNYDIIACIYGEGYQEKAVPTAD